MGAHSVGVGGGGPLVHVDIVVVVVVWRVDAHPDGQMRWDDGAEDGAGAGIDGDGP